MSGHAKQRSIGELKEEVARLEQAVEGFERRIEQARWINAMLDRAKAPHPRFSFWEWAHKNFPSETVQRRVERVIGELYVRVLGTWEPDPETDRDIPGVPLELLYAPHSISVWIRFRLRTSRERSFERTGLCAFPETW